jgi:hypothetical protein
VGGRHGEEEGPGVGRQGAGLCAVPAATLTNPLTSTPVVYPLGQGGVRPSTRATAPTSCSWSEISPGLRLTLSARLHRSPIHPIWTRVHTGCGHRAKRCPLSTTAASGSRGVSLRTAWTTTSGNGPVRQGAMSLIMRWRHDARFRASTLAAQRIGGVSMWRIPDLACMPRWLCAVQDRQGSVL